MHNAETSEQLRAFKSKMAREDASAIAMDTFAHYYRCLANGERGMISDAEITPVTPGELADATDLGSYETAGAKAMQRAVMIRLNGGLGTSMGLTGPKSLLTVKEGKSFLDIIVRQAERGGIPLCLMNSFSTHDETLRALAGMATTRSPLLFMQNKYPKVMINGLSPVNWPWKPGLEWNPPGHGDVFTSLYASGVLDELLSMDIEYAFIANVDNLGATMDAALLGYFEANRFPFMMEVAEKTPSDIKGGHLARLNNGRLVLRESAQCPATELTAFTDINRYRFFNTNNIWVNLVFLKHLLKTNKALHLPMIVNRKTVDPRDDESPGVYQIETAMGSAISLFDGATAVKIPRSRFLPVKKSNDLMVLRSDCYLFSPAGDIIANPERTLGPLKIDLNPDYYQKVDDFNRRFSKGVPSLVDCESLAIHGDVFFEGGVTVVGRTTIRHKSTSPAVITAGSVLRGEVTV